jgi:uridylate kinase
MDCDAIFKGTKVDGVYSAIRTRIRRRSVSSTISFIDVLTKDLKVMDATAISLARENNIPIVIFSVSEKGNFAKVVRAMANSRLLITKEDQDAR